MRMDISFTRNLNTLPQQILASLDAANVFYTEPYRRFMSGPGKDFLYLHTSDFMVPAIVTKKLIFKYADLCTEPFSLSASNLDGSEKNFLDQVVQLLREQFGAMWIRQTPVTALFNTYPTGSAKIPFGSYMIDLSKTEEEIWTGFSTSYRKYGRQCRDAGGIVKTGGEELLDDFYQLLAGSMSRAKAGIEPKNYYRKILTDLQPFAKIFVAYRDSLPEAGVLIIFNKRMSYTFYGGISSSPHKGSNILLYWEAMRWMKSAGVRTFSFVGCRINVDKGSKYEGIQTFKERFGGELKQGFMFKTVHNQRMMQAYCLAQKIRMALKGSRYPGDIIDQEIHKWPDR